MKKVLLMQKLFAFIVVLAGCSPVMIYSDAGLTKKSGLKYYTVKPYLQVERDIVSNNITKAVILYLPDLENPQYIGINKGTGSGKFDLKLTDGTISTIGLATDPETSESVEALAALIAKGSAGIADLAALKGLPSAVSSSSVTELYDIIMTDGQTTLKKIDIK